MAASPYQLADEGLGIFVQHLIRAHLCARFWVCDHTFMQPPDIEHKEFLEAGNKFELPTKEFKPEMFPKDYYVSLLNGKYFPKQDWE